MDLNDTPEQAEYRARIRAKLEELKPHAPKMRSGIGADDISEFRAWQHRLAEAGLVGVMWPEEYGGQGGGPIEQVIVNGEMRAAGLPGILDMIGVGNLGPTVIAHGTDEQKERHLSPLLHGEEMWCQLFSEPAAGSDLAGITTKAVLADGTWRINGQKVWTTMAHHASFGLMLARTDPDVPKHKGLTMFIVPLDAPGVTVRPLRLISGSAHFNEVFFDDVELPESAAVGAPGEGWVVAMTTLMWERFTLLTAFELLGWSAEQMAAPFVDAPDSFLDSSVRRRIAANTADMLSLRYSSYRALSAISRGEIPGPESGLGKITMINAGMRGAELACELRGPEELDGFWGEFGSELVGLRSGGGTEEIVRNLIGDRVLGLPPEPRVDKDKAFSELSRKAVSA